MPAVWINHPGLERWQLSPIAIKSFFSLAEPWEKKKIGLFIKKKKKKKLSILGTVLDLQIYRKKSMKSSYIPHTPSLLLLTFSPDAARGSPVVNQREYIIHWSPYFVQISPGSPGYRPAHHAHCL